MNIVVCDTIYKETCTLGAMLIDGVFFGYTLQDKTRPVNEEKVPGETAIPAGKYNLKITNSNRFQRMMPQIMNVKGFTGIRIHGGNTDKDTSGCILVAHNIDVKKGTVWGSMSNALINKLLLSEDVTHTIEIVKSHA